MHKSSFLWVVLFAFLAVLLLIGKSSALVKDSNEIYDCSRKRLIFIPIPDSSHVRDISDVAKGTSLILNAKCKEFNISQVKVLTVSIWKSVLEEIANNSKSEFFPHEQYFTPVMISNITDPKLNQRLKEMEGFRKSETSKMKRYSLGMDIITVPYSVIVQSMDQLFEQDPELRSIKEESPQDLLFVVDITAISAIDYVQREGFNFVVVNIMPSVVFNQYTPQYIGRFPFTTTSLDKLERIYNEEGILKYLSTRFYEEIYIQGHLILEGIKSIGKLNADRRAHNMTEKSELIFTSSVNTFIHFTAPGVLDYSYPISHNHRFVGYKAKSAKSHKLAGKPNLFNGKLGDSSFELFDKNHENLSDDEMVKWLDDKLERKMTVVYVAFGTKLEIAKEHITTILEFVVKSDDNVQVICVHEGHDKLNLTDATLSRIFFQTWVNQELILSHPAISVFVTHAGAHSIFEAVDNQVPMLTFPIFADQFSNSIRAEDLGFGFDVSEDIYNRDEKSFVKSLRTLISDRKEIKKKMREIKKINQNIAKLSISTVQSLGDSFTTVIGLVSNNVLTAGEIISDVVLDNLDKHLQDVSNTISWYLQINIPLLFAILILLTIVSITFQYCSRRNSK